MTPQELLSLGLALAMGCALGVLIDRGAAGTRSAPVADRARIEGGRDSLPAEASAAVPAPEAGERAVSLSEEALGKALNDLHRERSTRRRTRKMQALVETMGAAGIVKSLATLKRPYLTPKEQAFAVALIDRWAALDPKAALDYAQSIPAYAQRSTLVNAAATSWAADQPKAALDWLASLPNGELRRSVLEGVVSSVGQQDPSTALQFIASIPGYEQLTLTITQSEIFKAWAARDPAGAASRALTLPLGSGRTMAAVASAWAQTDPQAALAWVERLPNADVRDNAFLETFKVWAETDQQAAADYVLTLPANEARDEAIRVAMGQLSSRSSAAALDFFQKLPLGAGRDLAAKQLVSGLVASDPLGAANFVTSLPPGQARDDATDEMARRWATMDVSAALDWARNLSGQNQTMALRAVLNGWSNDNPKAAADTVLAQFPLPEHEQIISDLALSEASPEQGVVWAEQTKNPQQRAQLLATLCRRWLTVDSDAAAQWIAKSTMLSKATKESLLGAPK